MDQVDRWCDCSASGPSADPRCRDGSVISPVKQSSRTPPQRWWYCLRKVCRGLGIRTLVLPVRMMVETIICSIVSLALHFNPELRPQPERERCAHHRPHFNSVAQRLVLSSVWAVTDTIMRYPDCTTRTGNGQAIGLSPRRSFPMQGRQRTGFPPDPPPSIDAPAHAESGMAMRARRPAWPKEPQSAPDQA